MNSLLEKIRKNSTIKEAEILSHSKYFNEKDMITTNIPALNVALSGQLDGGFVPGITLWCGPSKMGKSFFSLLMAKAYMDKYPDAVCIFMDCEFGIPTQYFVKLGIDMDRVVHVPIMNIEEFKFYTMKQLDGLTRNDRVVFVVDSLGNMASVKSQTDAIDGKDKTDMTRAKELRSIFRMITPYLNKLNIPFIAVNHVYLEQGCLAGDTLVKTANGNKPISEIEIGDQVVTPVGIKPVNHIFTPEEIYAADKTFLELSFDDGSTVRCTGNHKFLTTPAIQWESVVVKEWKPAQELTLGQHFYGENKRFLTGIRIVDPFPIYDISVPIYHCFELANGITAHNSMYPKAIVAGGQGVYLSSDTIFVMGRQQEKEGTDVTGYNFIINVEKSRYVREKSKIPINMMFEKGISKYSGLIDMALESGDVVKPAMGWYSRVDNATGEMEAKKWRLKDTGTKEFWEPILNSEKFQNWIKNNYQVSAGTMLTDEVIDSELDEIEEDDD